MWAFSIGACCTGSNHIGLEEGTLKDQVMVNQSFLNSGENSFGNSSANLDVVGTILKNLWLDDRNKTIILAD